MDLAHGEAVMRSRRSPRRTWCSFNMPGSRTVTVRPEEERDSLTASNWHELVLGDVGLSKNIYGFAVGDHNSTCLLCDDIGTGKAVAITTCQQCNFVLTKVGGLKLYWSKCAWDMKM